MNFDSAQSLQTESAYRLGVSPCFGWCDVDILKMEQCCRENDRLRVPGSLRKQGLP